LWSGSSFDWSTTNDPSSRTDVSLVSFSVTPEQDTPAVLASYARNRQIDTTRWTLLTGSREQLFRAARTFYYADDGRRLTGAPEDFLHTEKVLLVDRHGRLRGVYNGTARADIRHLIADAAWLRTTKE
jgi:protein SCO1/2